MNPGVFRFGSTSWSVEADPSSELRPCTPWNRHFPKADQQTRTSDIHRQKKPLARRKSTHCRGHRPGLSAGQPSGGVVQCQEEGEAGWEVCSYAEERAGGWVALEGLGVKPPQSQRHRGRSPMRSSGLVYLRPVNAPCRAAALAAGSVPRVARVRWRANQEPRERSRVVVPYR